MSPGDQIRRGIQAEAELRVTGEAFAEVRERMVKALLATDAGAKEERERLYRAVRVLDDVREQMIGYIAAGQHAEKANEIVARTSQGPLP